MMECSQADSNDPILILKISIYTHDLINRCIWWMECWVWGVSPRRCRLWICSRDADNGVLAQDACAECSYSQNTNSNPNPIYYATYNGYGNGYDNGNLSSDGDVVLTYSLTNKPKVRLYIYTI